MSLSRQQKRAMFRRLNDMAKMEVVLDRIENVQDNEKLNQFEQRRNERLKDMAFSLLVFIFGFVMANITLLYFYSK
jgi:hypothetical protein